MTKFSQEKQNINGNQTNIGGNQVIQNIILVGQFLNLAQAKDLLPKHTNKIDVHSIAEAFDKGFNQHLSAELANATAEAGRILSPILIKFAPKDDFFIVPLDQVIRELVKNIGEYFTERNYWRAYSIQTDINDTIQGKIIQGRGVFLDSTYKIFKSRKAKTTNFLIIDTPSTNIPYMGKDAKLYNGSLVANLLNLPYDELQLLLTGIIIDTIKFCSTTSNHTSFWNSVTDVINANSKNYKRQK